MSLIWISKAVILFIEEKVMSLSVFYYCICDFPHCWCSFKPTLCNNYVMIIYLIMFIHNYLTYCNLIWASTYVTNLEGIYLLQKRAVRAISKADYKASSKTLFANLKILDVSSIYLLQVSSFMYLYHNDALPIAFNQIFQTGNQIHQYSTRSSDFYRPHSCRTDIKKFSILFQGPKIGNSLPNNIKNAPTFNIFKRVIKPFLRVRQDTT